MVLNLQKTVTEQKTIPVPCFWKNGSCYYGLIDNSNLYQVLCLNDYHTIVSCVPGTNMTILNSFADDSAELITEEQFFSAYDEARRATDLTPQIKEESYLQTITSALQLTPKEA